MTAIARRVLGAVPITAALAVVLLAVAGCGARPPDAQVEAARRTRAQKLIDDGNEAYRGGDYRLAARRYAAAAVVSKQDPAAYFGLGMALSKLGRDEEARSAYAQARTLARQKAVLTWPGAPPPDTLPASTR